MRRTRKCFRIRSMPRITAPSTLIIEKRSWRPLWQSREWRGRTRWQAWYPSWISMTWKGIPTYGGKLGCWKTLKRRSIFPNCDVEEDLYLIGWVCLHLEISGGGKGWGEVCHYQPLTKPPAQEAGIYHTGLSTWRRSCWRLCFTSAFKRDFQAEAVTKFIASLLTLCTIRISLKVQFITQIRVPKKQQGSKHKASGSARPSVGVVTWVKRWLPTSGPKNWMVKHINWVELQAARVTLQHFVGQFQGWAKSNRTIQPWYPI